MFFFTLVLLLGVIHKRLRVGPSACLTCCTRLLAAPTQELSRDMHEKAHDVEVIHLDHVYVCRDH